jgi:hypothetical protein
VLGGLFWPFAGDSQKILGESMSEGKKWQINLGPRKILVEAPPRRLLGEVPALA